MFAGFLDAGNGFRRPIQTSKKRSALGQEFGDASFTTAFACDSQPGFLNQQRRLRTIDPKRRDGGRQDL